MIPSKVMLTRAPVPRRAEPNPEMLTMWGPATSSHLQRCRVPAQEVWNIYVANDANGLYGSFCIILQIPTFWMQCTSHRKYRKISIHFIIRNTSHIISFFAMRHFKKILWYFIFHHFFSQRDTSGSLSRTNMESWCHLLTLMLCHWPGMIWKRILSKRSCLAIFIIIPGVFPYPWANWPHGVRLVWLVLFVPFRTNPILRHFL